MNQNDRKKVIITNALLMAALFGLVSLNKEFLRPALKQNEMLMVFTGCLPNFLAAYLISLAPVSAVLIRKLQRGRLLVYGFSVAVFIVLTIEEIRPMWGASTHYDTCDIIASGIGSLLAILSFEFLLFYANRKKIKD